MMNVVLVFGAVSIAGAKFDAMSGFQEPGSGDTQVSPLDGFSAGSENVSKNQFYVGFCWPVPVSSGHMTGWVSSPCCAALVLMRFCGSAPVCLCGFCPADAACRWLLIYFGVLTFLWFRNLCWCRSRRVNGLRCGAHFIIREANHEGCKGQQQHVAATC